MNAEHNSLALLGDIQKELSAALAGLNGTVLDGLIEQYYAYGARHICRASDGYLLLRKSGKLEASQHLIRTAIEVMLRVMAVVKKPEMMFRIAYTEFLEDEKWAKPLGEPQKTEGLKNLKTGWTDFKQLYLAKYPTHLQSESKLDLRSAAVVGGMDAYYDTHYRLYCRYTHGAFRATTGALSEFGPEDNRTMSICTLAILEIIVPLGAIAPNLPALQIRLHQI